MHSLCSILWHFRMLFPLPFLSPHPATPCHLPRYPMATVFACSSRLWHRFLDLKSEPATEPPLESGLASRIQGFKELSNVCVMWQGCGTHTHVFGSVLRSLQKWFKGQSTGDEVDWLWTAKQLAPMNFNSMDPVESEKKTQFLINFPF